MEAAEQKQPSAQPNGQRSDSLKLMHYIALGVLLIVAIVRALAIKLAFNVSVLWIIECLMLLCNESFV